MIKASELIKDYYRPGEIAQMLGVHTRTVQRYDINGELKFERLSSGRRRISKEDFIKYLEKRDLLIDDLKKRYDIIYVRVSTKEELEKGTLDRQIIKIVEKADRLIDPIIIKEVESGLDEKRKGVQDIIERVLKYEVRNVYVTRKDRLCRFGFEYLKSFFSIFKTEIIEIESETEDNKNEKLEDVMNLIQSMSLSLTDLIHFSEIKNNAH